MQNPLPFPDIPDIRPRRLIRELPLQERPLTRLYEAGPVTLSNIELLALILGTADGIALAEDVLVRVGGIENLPRQSERQLEEIPGMGEALAARLTAVIEFGRRVMSAAAKKTERPLIDNPAKAANLLMAEMMSLPQEHVRLVMMDTRNRLLGAPTIYVGSLNSSIVRLAELFRPALIHYAAAVIVVHNHPSGDPSPSPEDVNVTRSIVQAGEVLGISVLDHVIIGNGRYVSLRERGLGF